jgi:hypothetical protein
MELRELIAQGEHQQLDFKFRVDDARKIARTLTAFREYGRWSAVNWSKRQWKSGRL